MNQKQGQKMVNPVIEKKFYLESGSKIQEIGLRMQIASFLIASGITEGNAINDEDPKKVIVAIRAADEKQIEEIKENLVKHLNKLHGNDFCYENFPSDISASDLFELNNPHTVNVIYLNNLADSLMLEQTSKGAGAMNHMADNMNRMADSLKLLNKLDKLDILPEMAKTLKEILNKKN